MGSILKSDLKKKCSKWPFAVILLLSFFSFSGIIIQPRPGPYSQQTTLVTNPQISFVKSISYKRALRLTYSCYSASSFFTISTFDISRLHSRQIRTSIYNLSMSYKCRPRIVFFLPVKMLPQNAGDYPASLLG